MGIRNSKTRNLLIIIGFGTDCHVDPLGLLAMTGFFDSLWGGPWAAPVSYYEKSCERGLTNGGAVV